MPDDVWNEIHGEGERLLRAIHDGVLDVAVEYDAHCKAHPEKRSMFQMGPLVAYVRDAIRGIVGAWECQSLVSVTLVSRSLLEAVLIIEDIIENASLAERFWRYGRVAQLVDRWKDSTGSDEERQSAADEIAREFPEWCRRDAAGKVTGYHSTWRADDKRIEDVARKHGWKDTYDQLYRDCSAYVHPTSLLGLLALASQKETSHVRGLIVQRTYYGALFAVATVLGVGDAFGMKPGSASGLHQLVGRLEALFNRAHDLLGFADAEGDAAVRPERPKS